MSFKQQDHYNYVGGQVAGSESAIHAMYIFSGDSTEGTLLIDAENVFNSINRKVMIRNLKFICPVIATYISNCYMNVYHCCTTI